MIKSKLIKLYSANGWKKYFLLWRFWAAPYNFVNKLVPKSGNVVELGCGEGFFTNMLGLSSSKRSVTGIEIDSKRFGIADKKINNVKFSNINALNYKNSKVECFILMHLLHHLNSFKDQEKLLQNCAANLKKGGKIIIIEIEKDYSLKYFLTSFWDHFMVPIFFDKKLFEQHIYFRSEKEWIDVFKELPNKKLNIYRERQNMPFNHIIFEIFF